tara:strand:+ start:502 stop:1830 length:1329 start_codon:yes stop_codon:yes gene_type:complete
MDKAFFTGWGNVKRSESFLREPTSADEVRKIILSSGSNGSIARGSGRSYGDQAMNEHGNIIRLSSQAERWSQVDNEAVITVSSSVTFSELLKYLVPLGWYLPVVPGTGFVTIGGAIAADIHGKNHFHTSSLASHIQSITLILADGDIVKCSPTSEGELFWATVGGLGLTGVILEANIRLTRIQSDKILVNTRKFDQFPQLFEALKSTVPKYHYSVAWLDLISKDKDARGILETGNHESSGESIPLAYKTKPIANIPKGFPNKLLNARTLRIYNALRFNSSKRGGIEVSKLISEYLHPLDKFGNWNRLYGQSGLIQWQVVIPDESEDVLFEIIQSITKSGHHAFLAVLKKLGPTNYAPLSFPMSGWTLAVDFPASGQGLYEYLNRLDHEVIKAGGRLYLAKDIRLEPQLLSRMYPRLDEWKLTRKEVDPHGRWQSDFSRRLGL